MDATTSSRSAAPKHRPDWAPSPPRSGAAATKATSTTVCNDRATLIWMAQLATLEAHPSLSLAAAERPTVLAFDLDPERAGGHPQGQLPRGAPPARHVHALRPSCVPKDVGVEGPAGVRAPEWESHLQARRSRSRTPSPRRWSDPSRTASSRAWPRICARARCSWTGARTTGPRQPLPSTRCALASTQPSRPRRAGTRSRRPPPAATPTGCASRRRTCSSAWASTGDLFAPVLELKQKLPTAAWRSAERLTHDRTAAGRSLVEAAHRGGVGRLLGDLRVALRLGEDQIDRLGEIVERLPGLGLGGLEHQRLVDHRREVDGRRRKPKSSSRLAMSSVFVPSSAPRRARRRTNSCRHRRSKATGRYLPPRPGLGHQATGGSAAFGTTVSDASVSRRQGSWCRRRSGRRPRSCPQSRAAGQSTWAWRNRDPNAGVAPWAGTLGAAKRAEPAGSRCGRTPRSALHPARPAVGCERLVEVSGVDDVEPHVARAGARPMIAFRLAPS